MEQISRLPGKERDAEGHSGETWEDDCCRTIENRLRALQEEDFAAFQRRLMPTLAGETVLGVRTPALRALSREFRARPEAGPFLRHLPHRYFEENQLHAFLISGGRDMEETLRDVDAFLPYVDNWATCDQLSPAVFGKHPEALLARIRTWLQSEDPYAVRFAIRMLMVHFLDERFTPEYPALVASVRREEYYIRMMAAWYFATALAKQYEAAVGFLQTAALPRFTHNKAIQKAVESRRISPEQKAYLRTLKRETA